MAQKNRVFEISMGTGAIVFGLAAVIIGTNIFKNRQKVNSSTAAIVGSIIYKACVALALSMGLVPQDLKTGDGGAVPHHPCAGQCAQEEGEIPCLSFVT